MIWRALVFFDVLTVGSYVYRDQGEAVAWVVIAGIMAILLPLAKAVSHLAKIERHLAGQTALLSKILKGYAR